MMSFRFSRLLTLSVALVMVAALLPVLPSALRSAEAQGGVIAYGDVVSGRITAKNVFEMWQFTGAKGDRVQIMMEGDGNLDTYLGLLDALTETVLVEDDDSGGNGNAYIDMTLPASGDYIIVATRYNFDTGTTEGTYTLQLLGSGGPTSVTTTVSTTNSGPVEIEAGVYFMGDMVIGDSVSGAIENNAYAQLYGIEVQAGTELVIGMFSDSSELDSYLFFADENFDLLAEDDDTGADVGAGPLDAFIQLTVPQTGYYYVVATRAGMDTGFSTGAYVLAVGVPEVDPGASPVVDDGLPAGVDYMAVLSAGGSASGVITDASYVHLYDYNGQAGEEITIVMTSGTAGLDAYLGLLDPAGEVVAEDDDSFGGLDAMITVKLPESGVYTIVATRAGLDEGTSTGDYLLEVTAGQIEPPPTGAFSGFGGLPGRAMTSDSGTYYLRGNGSSDNPEKSPPIEEFFRIDTALPGTPSPVSGLIYGSDPLAPFGAIPIHLP